MPPVKLNLRKDAGLSVTWEDGLSCDFTLARLRRDCPCAACKETRKRVTNSRLAVLPDTGSVPLSIVDAKLVGNYALRIDWSDGHSSGIYSFDYLRSLASPSA
jgi:DUF971 family protein